MLAVASIVSSHLLYCTPSKIDHEELGFLELLSRKAHEWANRRARDAAAAVAEIEVTGQIRPQGSADGLAAGAAAAAAARSGREPQVPRSGARGSLEDPDTAIGTLRLVAVRSLPSREGSNIRQTTTTPATDAATLCSLRRAGARISLRSHSSLRTSPRTSADSLPR